MTNACYSQHLEDGKSDNVQDASGRGARQGEVYKDGEGERSTKMKGAGRNCDVYKDGGAGLSTKMEDEGAGRKDDEYKDEGAGQGAKKKDEGAGRCKEVRSIRGGGRRATRWVKVNLGGRRWTFTTTRGVTSPSSHPRCTRSPWARW
jgi:hypothetical protein